MVHDEHPRGPSADLYLSLLKRALTGALAEDGDVVLGGVRVLGKSSRKYRIADRIGALTSARLGIELVLKRPYEPALREGGLDWPARAESMIGLRRMDNIQYCVETVLRDGVPGDLIEAGVWRGGAAIFMRGVLEAHADPARKVWVADSFAGLPAPDPQRYPADRGDRHHEFYELAVGVDQVKNNFRRYGLLDDRVEFLVGWFKDTLPTAPISQLAVLRVDGDMYESTIQTMEPLYPRLVLGGFCIVDDYLLPGCNKAIHTYRDAHAITDEIIDIDGVGAYWRKAG